MILTVTINPLLERRLIFNSINLEEVNRGGKSILQPGGKGINVSRQLNMFNVKNFALTFTGGLEGKLFKEFLHKEKIDFTSIQTQFPTRYSSIILNRENKKILSFFSEDQQITKEEADQFKHKLEKIIQNSEIIIFSGSSPCENTDDIFSFGIQTANKFDKISILDTYGKHYEECLKSSPTVIHNNLSEVEHSLNLNLSDEKDKIEFMKDCYGKGVKQVFITDGKNPTYASNFDYHFKAIPFDVNAIDAIGSGDAFTAGLTYCWYHDLTFEIMLKYASTVGTLNSTTYNVCSVPQEDVEENIDKVIIESIGKKKIRQ